MKKKWLAISVIVILIGFAIVQSTQHSKSTGGQQMVTSPGMAPDFALKTLGTSETASLSVRNGKPAVIMFWASWCEYCQQETPDVIKLQAKYKNQIELISVNLTSRDSEQDAQSFVDHYKIKYPVLLDEKGEMAQQYSVRSTPTLVFVDADGKIKEKVNGYLEPAVLEEKMIHLVGKNL